MAKGGQSIGDMQDRILGQMHKNEKRSLTALEQQLIDASNNKIANDARLARIEKEKKDNRVSFYVPGNPLNGFNGKTKAQQAKILEDLKAAEKAKVKEAKDAVNAEAKAIKDAAKAQKDAMNAIRRAEAKAAKDKFNAKLKALKAAEKLAAKEAAKAAKANENPA